MVQQYTLEEVSKHASKDDLWVIIHNKVYDITKYLEDHPGGIPVLVEVAGKDATAEFEDVGHSDEAMELLKPFLVGEIPSTEKKTFETYRPQYETVSTVSDTSRKSVWKARLRRTLIKLTLLGPVAYFSIGALRKKNLTLAPFSLGNLSHIREVVLASTSGGFWVGFGAATAASSTIAFAAVSYINNLLNEATNFTKFPPTRKFPRRPLPHKPVAPKVLDPRIYRQFPLIRKDKLSHDSYRFVFQLPNATDSIGLPTGQHVSIRAKINGETVMRSYTPTSNNTDLGRLELVIKAYPNGKLTSYLTNLALGAQVEFAGPKGAMKYSRGLCKHIGMVAGGSGITPMYQVIRAICEDPSDSTTVSLLFANRTEGDILLRRELDGFAEKYPQKFKVHYILDNPPEKWAYTKGYVTKELIAERLPAAASETKIMLCGPPGMIKATTANLVALGFDKPGAFSKAGDQVFVF